MCALGDLCLGPSDAYHRSCGHGREVSVRYVQDVQHHPQVRPRCPRHASCVWHAPRHRPPRPACDVYPLCPCPGVRGRGRCPGPGDACPSRGPCLCASARASGLYPGDSSRFRGLGCACGPYGHCGRGVVGYGRGLCRGTASDGKIAWCGGCRLNGLGCATYVCH